MNNEDYTLNKIGCIIVIIAIVISIIWGVVAGLKTAEENKIKAEYNREFTRVHLIHGGYEDVKNSSFVGSDTIFIGSDNVYKNNTGRDLVEYSVQYTSIGYSILGTTPIGTLIKPNEYFFWNFDDKYYQMFCTPPPSISVVSYNGRAIDFTFMHFLDYASDVSDRVTIH